MKQSVAVQAAMAVTAGGERLCGSGAECQAIEPQRGQREGSRPVTCSRVGSLPRLLGGVVVLTSEQGGEVSKFRACASFVDTLPEAYSP